MKAGASNLLLPTFSKKFLHCGTGIADLAFVTDSTLFHNIEFFGEFGGLEIHTLQMFHGSADFLLQLLMELISRLLLDKQTNGLHLCWDPGRVENLDR
eukprot:Skav221536  [mRNA]  locus=scaffold1813:83922:84215:- [translate_table: standard]